MNKKEALNYYKKIQDKYNAYSYVLSVAYYDKETIAPLKGSKERGKQLAYMDGELFEIMTDPKNVEAVCLLSKEDLGEVGNRNIELSKKSLENVLKFTKEESIEFSLLCNDSFYAWQEAKQKNNYQLFKPYLIKLIEISKKRAIKRNPNVLPYELYLDDYEEGMNIKKYDEFFSLIKKELLPLIKEVDKNQDKVDDSFLYKYYPKEKQKIFMKELIHYLGFDSGWGYVGESEHPFTMGFLENDARITTSYDEYNITSCIYSIIHEVGHAYYEHQIDHKFQESMIGRMISSGMHESQSRFLENYLGRRKSFWIPLYPKLQKIFKENLGNVTIDEFVKAINASRSSLIRVNADELTYPIHILIRYEIEKDIFANKINLNNLNKIWNKKYKEYLGVEQKNEKEGILQDVHWSAANFGYFPTYALGSAIGAQLLNTMEKEIDVDSLLSKSKFAEIEKYLKKNIQKYGALYNYEKILKMSTGETFKPKYYINYLKKKYKNLYKIK